MSPLFQELKRRNVFRVAIAYLAVAWLVLQAADIVLENIAAPGWLMQAVMFFMLAGFPVAILFAWAFEMTPDGIKKEAEVDRSTSITDTTGKKLDRMIIGVLGIAVVFLLIDKFMLDENTPETSASTSDKSVAVLPFVAMSNGPDDEYFSDGLTEEILNSLTRVQDLLVTARTSAFHFKGQDLPIPEIAATLGVAHIVEGSVRREGDRIRVTAQLIRAEDGFHLWSENYDRDSDNSFDVQTDIAEKIATALGVVLDDEQLQRMHAAGLRDPEAFVAYQKGREFYNSAHGSGDLMLERLTTANEWFDRALILAPDLSEAHRMRSDLSAHTLIDAAYGEDVPAAEQAAAFDQLIIDLDNAIRTAPSPAHRLAIAYDKGLLTGQWRQLTAISGKILEYPDCVAGGWMDVLSIPYGWASEHMTISQRETECDPLTYSGWRSLSMSHLSAGDAALAIESAEKGIAAKPHTALSRTLFNAYLSAGRFNEAEALIVQTVDRHGTQHAMRIMLAAARGESKVAKNLFDEYLAADYADYEILVTLAAVTGNRGVANNIAAEADSRPYGYLVLMQIPVTCACGAPFDLDVTPNFAKLLEDAEISWPPVSSTEWPLKDW